MEPERTTFTTVVETMGRARLERVDKTLNPPFGDQSARYAIIIVNNVGDDFNAIPRPVRHVGQGKHVLAIWSQMKKQRSKFEQNTKYIRDFKF